MARVMPAVCTREMMCWNAVVAEIIGIGGPAGGKRLVANSLDIAKAR